MTDKRIEVLQMIQKDIEKDIKEFEGAPFTGRNVSELFGRQAAAIEALARILESIIEEEE